MASLDANENAPTPKRVCKPAQNPSKPARTPPPKSADNEPLAKIDRENFFGSISLKPNEQVLEAFVVIVVRICNL